MVCVAEEGVAKNPPVSGSRKREICVSVMQG